MCVWWDFVFLLRDELSVHKHTSGNAAQLGGEKRGRIDKRQIGACVNYPLYGLCVAKIASRLWLGKYVRRMLLIAYISPLFSHTSSLPSLLRVFRERPRSIRDDHLLTPFTPYTAAGTPDADKHSAGPVNCNCSCSHKHDVHMYTECLCNVCWSTNFTAANPPRHPDRLPTYGMQGRRNITTQCGIQHRPSQKGSLQIIDSSECFRSVAKMSVFILIHITNCRRICLCCLPAFR